MANIIAIVKIKTGDYKVANGRLSVEIGEEVSMINNAGSEASIEFINENPFGKGKDFKLGNGKEKNEKMKKSGSYEYKVTVNGENAPGSRPIIIVYP